MPERDIAYTKDLISLSGSLDWRVRNGRSLKDCKSLIRAMRFNLTKVEALLQEEDKK